MYGISYFCYYLTNHYPIYPPVELPKTWIDLNAPFWPWSVLVYTSEYFYFAFVFFQLRNHDNINKYLYSFFTLQIFSCAIFLFYPTIYPRDALPISSIEPGWLRAIWTWLHQQDAPTNCLPSLHVSSVYLSSFVFLTDGKNGRPGWFRFYAIWGTLIALSTLTTKQHYLADIVSGLGLAIFFYWWFHRRQKYFYLSPALSTEQV